MGKFKSVPESVCGIVRHEALSVSCVQIFMCLYVHINDFKYDWYVKDLLWIFVWISTVPGDLTDTTPKRNTIWVMARDRSLSIQVQRSSKFFLPIQDLGAPMSTHDITGSADRVWKSKILICLQFTSSFVLFLYDSCLCVSARGGAC